MPLLVNPYLFYNRSSLQKRSQNINEKPFFVIMIEMILK